MGYQGIEKGTKQLQTFINIFMTFSCEIFEFFVGSMSRNDKVYKLDTSFNPVHNSGMYIHTCPVEDCPPSFIHQPGKTASWLFMRLE